jgi:hypothetical protein
LLWLCDSYPSLLTTQRAVSDVSISSPSFAKSECAMLN